MIVGFTRLRLACDHARVRRYWAGVPMSRMERVMSTLKVAIPELAVITVTNFRPLVGATSRAVTAHRP